MKFGWKKTGLQIDTYIRGYNCCSCRRIPFCVVSSVYVFCKNLNNFAIYSTKENVKHTKCNFCNQSKCLNRQYNLLFQQSKTPNYHQPYFAEGRRQFPDLGARIPTNIKNNTLEEEATPPGQIRFKIIWSGMDNYKIIKLKNICWNGFSLKIFKCLDIRMHAALV